MEQISFNTSHSSKQFYFMTSSPTAVVIKRDIYTNFICYRAALLPLHCWHEMEERC
jgi:hypothetical protein